MTNVNTVTPRPRESVPTTSEEISVILYANGHSTYHPVLVEQLTNYVEAKFEKLRKEQEALSKVNHYDVARMNILYKLNESAKNDDRDGVTIYSQALQRI